MNTQQEILKTLSRSYQDRKNDKPEEIIELLEDLRSADGSLLLSKSQTDVLMSWLKSTMEWNASMKDLVDMAEEALCLEK